MKATAGVTSGRTNRAAAVKEAIWETPFDWTDTPAASGADLGRRGRANRGNEPIAEGKAYLRRRGLRTSRSRPGITLAGLSLYESMII